MLKYVVYDSVCFYLFIRMCGQLNNFVSYNKHTQYNLKTTSHCWHQWQDIVDINDSFYIFLTEKVRVFWVLQCSLFMHWVKAVEFYYQSIGGNLWTFHQSPLNRKSLLCSNKCQATFTKVSKSIDVGKNPMRFASETQSRMF